MFREYFLTRFTYYSAKYSVQSIKKRWYSLNILIIKCRQQQVGLGRRFKFTVWHVSVVCTTPNLVIIYRATVCNSLFISKFAHVFSCFNIVKIFWCLQDQYAFCYRAALEYLGSFDHYANWWRQRHRPADAAVVALTVHLTAYGRHLIQSYGRHQMCPNFGDVPRLSYYKKKHADMDQWRHWMACRLLG